MLRGVDTLSAMLILAELHDFRRCRVPTARRPCDKRVRDELAHPIASAIQLQTDIAGDTRRIAGSRPFSNHE